MRAYHSLPAGYREICQINLQKDKRTALKVNIGAAAVMFIMVAAGCIIAPLREYFFPGSVSDYLIRLSVLILGYTAYMAAHELTHAAVMKAVGGGKVVFGFTGMYAFAGSKEDFFDKISYRCIALAPVIVWGILFAILTVLVPKDWFWIVWFLQAGNLGGAAGDVYVTIKLWNMPGTILVKDTGVDMTVYDR